MTTLKKTLIVPLIGAMAAVAGPASSAQAANLEVVAVAAGVDQLNTNIAVVTGEGVKVPAISYSSAFVVASCQAVIVPTPNNSSLKCEVIDLNTGGSQTVPTILNPSLQGIEPTVVAAGTVYVNDDHNLRLCATVTADGYTGAPHCGDFLPG